MAQGAVGADVVTFATVDVVADDELDVNESVVIVRAEAGAAELGSSSSLESVSESSELSMRYSRGRRDSSGS